MSACLSFARTPLRRATRLGLAAGLALCGAHALAVPWTAVGSTGVVDEDAVHLVTMSMQQAAVLSTAAAGTVVRLRYNVPALKGFAGANKAMVMRVRYLDNGPGGQVRLLLRRYNLAGSTFTKATFDSNNYVQSAGNQTQFMCFTMDSWNFSDASYYVEAELAKSAVGGAAGLAQIVLSNEACPV